MYNHPWELLFTALSADKTLEKAQEYLEEMDAGGHLTRELFDSYRIPIDIGEEISREVLQDYGVASFFSQYTTEAKELFATRPTRETIFLYLILGLNNAEIKKQLKKIHIEVEEDSIKFFIRFYWGEGQLTRDDMLEFGKTFLESNRDLVYQIYADEEAKARHTLGLPLEISELKMLTTVRDRIYLSVQERLSCGDIPKAMKESDALSKLIMTIQEVREYSLTEEEMKPLYKLSFDEAVGFLSMEDLVEEGHDITGGEARPDIEEVVNNGKSKGNSNSAT